MVRETQENEPLAEALAIGRKRRRHGQTWPMPIRETDLGHIYTDATIRPMAASRKQWTGRLLVDTGATDTFISADVLKSLGIKPAGRRSYELADGTWQELEIGFGVIEIMGEKAGATLVFAGKEEEPLLGVTVLESTGFWIDPQRERLIPRGPKRKSSYAAIAMTKYPQSSDVALI
ncbi:MAG: retroviral-like aspartic protease family protein [Phycisphaerales bacterium]|nr:retroviral-like aspartic protease family protein [Phycisphaerales bacterium]